jgi:hypothetical protein
LTYKTSHVIVIAFLLPLVTAQSGFAQYTIVYDLFKVSQLNPSGFDDVVARNSSKFDSRFHACLKSTITVVAALEKQSDNQCHHTDPGWQQKCLQENPVRGVPAALTDIGRVTRHEAAWLQTESGKLALQVAYTFEALMRSFDQEEYQQMRLLLGKPAADAKRAEMLAMLNGPRIQQFDQILRPVMLCN